MEMRAAIEQVWSELESIPFLKEEQNTALEAFLRGKDAISFLPTGFHIAQHFYEIIYLYLIKQTSAETCPT